MSSTVLPEVLRMQRDDGRLYRAARVAVTPATDDSQTRAISLAISSETPVLRYDWRTGTYYHEVLSHDPSAVDLSRAQNGLPLLLGHDQDEIVGRALGITVDADGVLRAADVKFSRSEDGQNAMMDVADGILTDTSVGYVVGDTYEEVKADGDEYPTRTYTSWTPFEVSLVAVPADPTVGVGRSAIPAPVITPDVALRAPEIRNMVEHETVTGRGESREAVIRSMCVGAGASAERAEAFVNSDKSVREIQGELIADLAARNATERETLALTPKEQKRYSLVSALNSLANGKRDGFEFEVSDQLARAMGKETAGLFMPTSLSAQNPAFAPDGRTLLSVGNKANTKGGETVFTEPGDFIDLLRNRMVTTTLGAQYLSGLSSDIGWPEQTAAGTFSWGAETANAALSSASTRLRVMSPKIGQSATTVSRQLLRQSSFDVENMIRNDIAAVHAIGIDSAAINGTGTGSQPTGIVNTAGIGSVVGGTNGAAPSYDFAVNLQRLVAAANAYGGNLAYGAHPLLAATMMRTQQFSGTNGVPLWTGNILDGQVAGFRAIGSTQFQSGLTKGTATGTIAHLVFGDWSSLVIGDFGPGLELIVDPFTSGPSVVKLMSIQMVDVFLRYPAKFAAMLDAVAA